MCIDTVEFSVRDLPNWHPVTINAYDLSESGINAIEEMGFALAIAFAYIDELCSRGLNVDQFAHRIPFICGVHIDIFEEAAKFRARAPGAYAQGDRSTGGQGGARWR